MGWNALLAAIGRISWLEVIRALAPVATAGIALLALRNWKRQDKAKREAEFLDELIEATHTYIVEMQRPVAMLHLAKIGIVAHRRDWEDESEEEKAVKGAIAYVQKRGEEDGKRLATAMSAVEPSVVKLRSLAAKGQVFRFRDYAKCQNAVAQLTWNFDRLLAFRSIIESPTWNWEHPEVRGLLTKVMAIEPDEIRESIGENNAAVLSFTRETYARIYG
jgi:hypothetical protein